MQRVSVAPRLAGRSGSRARQSAADCSLGFFPAWFGPPPGGLRLAGFPLPDDASLPALPEALAAFLQSGPPPILFTPGSFVRHAESFFRESLAACERLNARAVFLTPHREQVPAVLPPTAIHFKYVALQRLAPKAAALVHHGGIGTCVQAMKAGIAQLIVPVFFDQFDNAARVEALGTGKSILPGQYDGNAAAQQLNHLLHSGRRQTRLFAYQHRIPGSKSSRGDMRNSGGHGLSPSPREWFCKDLILFKTRFCPTLISLRRIFFLHGRETKK